jgi:hypothetical protein
MTVSVRALVPLLAAMAGLLPSPAGAKGLEQTLTIVAGPGFKRPLILEREEWGIPRSGSSPQAVVIEGLLGDPKLDRSPADLLGPAYEIHYQLSVYDPRADWPFLTLVRQRLYPYATPVPVTYTPQQFWRNPHGSNRVEAGWQRFPPPLVERLQRLGLPERPPSPQPQTVAPMALPVAFATVASALALAARAIRRRDLLVAP